VEVHGLEALVEPSPEVRVRNPDVGPVDVNGHAGRAIGWNQHEKKYVVETFDGVIVGVAEDNLREFHPPAPEEGGFDVAWPSGPFPQELFAELVVSCLAEKGYCLIQLFTPLQTQLDAMEEAQDFGEWHLPTKEFEVPYLGYDNSTKYANLPDDSLDRDPDGALGQLDRTLTNLGLLLDPLVEPYLGFTIWGRRGGMVRVPLMGSTEERLLRPAPLDDMDYNPGGKVYGHINFLERRKLQVMHMIKNEGGDLWLYPNANAGPEMRNVQLPVSKNKLLVFLPDLMSYSYKPRGDNLLLQTWYVAPPFISDPEDRQVVNLPDLQRGKRAMVMSLEFRYAGDAYGLEYAWSMWAAGADGVLKVPSNRFDIDMYYSPERYCGMLYTYHGACFSDTLMLGFDNDFFGISYAEARSMGPAQRNLLETGYEALHSAGYSKETARGLSCGVYLGDAGTDWVHSAASLQCQQGLEHSVSPHIRAGCSGGVTCSRLSHALALSGPCVGLDTACSSSLVAFGQAHHSLRDRLPSQLAPTQAARLTKALVMGVCLLDGPHTFFAYCAASMLSIGGRSFTFDEAANGFVRGEGCSCSFLKMDDSEEDAQQMLACAIGSNVNQDGRSASMTAPNGPSQQRCIKASMSEAGLRPGMITIAECHGTGTALGDPIEVSALRDIMKGRDGPIILTSAKSNFGHMEACAGLGGITKCILMLHNMCGAPNVHLRHMNPHIEFDGFPATFPSETEDCGASTGISGVSAFGVGGTNARADLWSRSMQGYLATQEVNTFKRLRLKSTLYARVSYNGTPGPMASDRVYITGTWNAWTEMVEMETLAEGEFGATIALGDTRWERFRIVLNEDERQSIYPVVDLSGPHGAAHGPDWEADGRSWLLDGRAEGAPAGAVYRVRFEWGFSWDQGEHKRVTWERLDAGDDAEALLVDGRAFAHSYSVAGTWTAWKCQPMEPCAEDASLHQAVIRVGATGLEEFQIVRDGDWTQVLHPAVPGASRTCIPVKGPDDEGQGKHWIVRGATGERLTVQLRLTEDETTVTMKSVRKGTWTWSSADKDDWHSYFVLGTWSRRGELEPMLPAPNRKGVNTCRVTLGPTGVEEFQIVRDGDGGQAMYPHRGGASCGEGALCGPDAMGDGLNWRIHGRPLEALEIVLDLNQEDPFKAVLWHEIDS